MTEEELAEMSRNEVKIMLLRCIIKEQNGFFVGTCLELSLSAMGKSVDECKRELQKIIDVHVKTVSDLYNNGEQVLITPVKYYIFKKLWFDCRYACKSIRFTGPPKNTFTKKVVVPAGV